MEWYHTKAGRQGDAIAFHADGKIILPSGVVTPGRWVQFSGLELAGSGRAYHGLVARTNCSDNEFCCSEEYVDHAFAAGSVDEAEKALVAALQQARKNAEQRVAATAARKEQEAAKQQAFDARMAELPADVAKFVVGALDADLYYDFSDDQRVWRAGRDRADKLKTQFAALSLDDQQTASTELPEERRVYCRAS